MMIRKRCTYSRISYEKKQVLVESVLKKKLKLHTASKLLGLKYSTAKSIMRKFVKKTQSFKEQHEDEDFLRKFLIKKQYQEKVSRKEIFVITKIPKNNKYPNFCEYKRSTYKGQFLLTYR
jgi:hypothetical protein